MAQITPNYTDAIIAMAIQTMARGAAPVDVELDLVSVNKSDWARIFLGVAKGGTTALSAGVDFRVHYAPNGDTAPYGIYPAGTPLTGGTAAPASTTVNVNSNALTKILNVASVTGFAKDDIIAIWDAGNAAFTRFELNQVAAVGASSLTLMYPLKYNHTAAQADTVRNQTDVWSPMIVPGGSIVRIAASYASQTTGDQVAVFAIAQLETGATAQ